MKKLFAFLTVSLLVAMSHNTLQAQFWSTKAVYSPHTSSMVGDASRVGYHNLGHVAYYMRYNDSSYFCSPVYYMLAYTPIATKILLPQTFIINQFKKFMTYEGFIGSNDGVGMYGWALQYYNYNQVNNLHLYKLPAIKQLNRTTLTRVPGEYAQLKAFAIGDKYAAKGPVQRCLMEFYAQGYGALTTPYYYAPLPIDIESGKGEFADDVITVDNYVVFSTRETRDEVIPVNLRISDTTSVLQNADIDNQWRFSLLENETVCSESRLKYLKDWDFALSYVVYDTIGHDGYKYFLLIHRINLKYFLDGNDAIVTYCIPLPGDCVNLVDVVYEPDVQTMVLLLNGNNRSEIYHIDPFVPVSIPVTKLYYPDGNLYSIDTMGGYPPYHADKYVAMGDSSFFSQDISNGIEIEQSCLEITKPKMLLQKPPVIEIIDAPIDRYFDYKIYCSYGNNARDFYGQKKCGLIDFGDMPAINLE